MQKIKDMIKNYAQNITQESDAHLEGARLYGYPEERMSQEELYLEKKIITELGKTALRQEYTPGEVPDTL